MPRRFDRWLFAPGDPRRLDAVRIGLCLLLAVRLARPVFGELAAQPRSWFRPLSFMTLFDAMPGGGTVAWIQAIGVACALLASAGIVARITLPIGWGSALVLFGMETSTGKVVHHDVLLLLAVVPLLAEPNGGGWAVRGRTAATPARAGWPVRTSGLVVAGAYLFTGLAKLVFTGPAWVFGDNLRFALFASSDARGGNDVALFIGGHPLLAHLAAAGVLLFELTAWAPLVRPALTGIYVAGSVAIHTGIWLAMGLDYTPWVVTLAIVYVDWPELAARWRSRTDPSTTLRVMDPYLLFYDADCGFCRWSVDWILRWDRRHRIRATTIQGAVGDRFLGDVPPAQRLASWHLRGPDGRRWSAGAAVAPLARLLPMGTPVALAAESFPGLVERAYRWVARHRDAIGRRLGEQACAVDPSAAAGTRGPAAPSSAPR